MPGTVVQIEGEDRAIMKHHLAMTQEEKGYQGRESMNYQAHQAIKQYADGLREKYPKKAAELKQAS